MNRTENSVENRNENRKTGIKIASLLRGTSFGEIGKRDVFIIRIGIENRIQLLQNLIRKAKRIMENWDEIESCELLEDLLWDICIMFNDCAVCPAEFVCEKKKIGVINNE